MIVIKDLHKNYGSNQILRGIDLRVKKSEVVVVIGPSGSGKSTLLRCVNYLEVPSSGTISTAASSMILLPSPALPSGMNHIGFNLKQVDK